MPGKPHGLVIEGIDVSRDVTLVLTDGAHVIGSLPPFEVPTPWWADVAVVIEATEQLTRRRVSILRLLNASASSSTMGGPATYLAEIDRLPTVRLSEWTGPDPLAPHRHRAWWAEPGALANAVAWATAALAETGIEVVEAHQQRTWNRTGLPTRTGPALEAELSAVLLRPSSAATLSPTSGTTTVTMCRRAFGERHRRSSEAPANAERAGVPPQRSGVGGTTGLGPGPGVGESGPGSGVGAGGAG
jgi:hypothetical protein